MALISQVKQQKKDNMLYFMLCVMCDENQNSVFVFVCAQVQENTAAEYHVYMICDNWSLCVDESKGVVHSCRDSARSGSSLVTLKMRTKETDVENEWSKKKKKAS